MREEVRCPVEVSAALRGLVMSVLESTDLELYDLEWVPGALKVVLDRPGGVDLDSLSDANRTLSLALDHLEEAPGGPYTLEVSSPGLERNLRTPAHFKASLGELVSVRTNPGVEGDRRVRGVLVGADEEAIVVRAGATPDAALPGGDYEDRRILYKDIERARTIFEWGTPKPESSRRSARHKVKAETTTGAPRRSRKSAAPAGVGHEAVGSRSAIS
ncbi:MAG: ribosome maturation factor RimP [Actinobacteria bacterium]|nr:ribosome maturation factor RimP [Actinomycetota bacterium]